jgi:hypothetical protein
MESQKENKTKFRPDPGLKLMDQVREVLRYKARWTVFDSEIEACCCYFPGTVGQ